MAGYDTSEKRQAGSDPLGNESIDMSVEDVGKTDVFLLVLHVALSVGLIVATVVAGYNALTWWLVIPAAGTASLGLRVARRVLRSALDREGREARRREESRAFAERAAKGDTFSRDARVESLLDYVPSADDLAEEAAIYSGDRERNVRRQRRSRAWVAKLPVMVSVVAVFVLFYGALWYGLGLLLRLIFTGG